MATEKPRGIDASLVILRQELECMQKQDKELYKQLLHLQDNIRGLKVELKREREECEEAFRDLQEISLDNEPEPGAITAEQSSQQSDVAKENKHGKHERQDSGISVRHSSSESELTTSNAGIAVKPMLIQHSKQDSGILIDEEAIKETTILSRLVQSSSRMFSKSAEDSRKIKYSPRSSSGRCSSIEQVNNTLLSPPQYCRSKSINDLYSEKTFRGYRDLNNNNSSAAALVANHVRTMSCPATSVRKLPLDSPYKVIACHQVRPKKRSASVVDLTRLTQDELLPTETRKPEIKPDDCALKRDAVQFINDAQKPLKAVFVCADEVRVSSATHQQNILSERRAVRMEPGLQRRVTVLGTRSNRPFQDGGGLFRQNERTTAPSATIASTQSFQYARHVNYMRHRTENVTSSRRRHSMQHIWHASSKSWDGSEGRIARRPSQQNITQLCRSVSQFSLV